MALDFPASPTNGQVYGSYVYNSAVGAWQAREDSATVATISTVLPTSANPGDIWYDSDDGTSYIYYDDGTSAQWVELLSSGLPLLNTKADLAGATFTGNVTAPRFISNIATGTSPLSVTSTTVNTNLNADLLDGNHATAFALLSGASFTGNLTISSSGTLINGTNGSSTIVTSDAGKTPLTVRGAASQTADLQQWQNSGGTVLADIDSAGVLTTPRVVSTQATGTAPFTVASTTVVPNLNADMIDGYHESSLVLTRGTGLSTNSTDFNTIVIPGSYNVGGNGNWTGSSNGPTSAYAYGQLVVTVNGNIVTQTYYTHTTSGHYIRTKYNASDWQAWQKFSTDYTDAARPLFSGTDTRALVITNAILNSSNCYNQIDYNVGNNFNASTGRFTAQVAGYYEASVHIGDASANSTGTNVRISKNGALNTGPLAEGYNQTAGGAVNVFVKAYIYCAVGDYIEFQAAALNTLGGVQHKRFLIRFIQ